MNNKENALTESQLTFMVIGSIIGISVLNLPLAPIKVAKQDAWIATFFRNDLSNICYIYNNLYKKKNTLKRIFYI